MPKVTLSPRSIAITLPTAMVNHSAVESHAVALMADLCGGCTIAAGAGAYIMRETGKMVTEPHTRVWAYVPAELPAAMVNAIVDNLAEYALAQSEEECILAETLDGPALYFRD